MPGETTPTGPRASVPMTRRHFGLATLGLLTAACSRSGEQDAGAVDTGLGDADGFAGTLVKPAPPRPALVLPDTEGQHFDLRDRPDGEVTVVFFGYTHCPDVCPTTMADLAQARRSLPERLRPGVQIVFITEDPERDTPPVLREWLDRFDADIVGLLGGTPETQRVLRELYLPETERVEDPETPIVHPDDGHEHPSEFGLEHAGIIYVFAREDRVLIYSGGFTPQDYADDFRTLTHRDHPPRPAAPRATGRPD